MIIKNGLALLGVSMMLVGCGGGGSSSSGDVTNPDTEITNPDTEVTTPDGNAIPLVDAGEDRSIIEDTNTHVEAAVSDSDGTVVSFQWTEDGMILSDVEAFTYTGTTVGEHVLTVTVTDDGGATASDTVTITVVAEEKNEVIPYDAPPISQATITEYLDAVNAARAVPQDCGTYGMFAAAEPVTWSDELYKAASEHSYDISVLGETSVDFDHEGTGTESDWTAEVWELGRGSKFWERTENNGYDNKLRGARSENVHASPSNIDDAMHDWIASDGHCANVMDPDADQVGVAMVENTDAAWRWYWTQVFGIVY